ncbi:MAG: methionyl-tRNA formyltransferase [Candidatus Paceibacteria bacterium]|jgi:methionyl-tRNA formyltransferase
MRCIFMGSPPFAMPVFEALLESGHSVLALVTRPDKPRGRGREIVPSDLVVMAQAAGVPVLQPTTTKTEAFVAELSAFQPDILLVASYGEILTENVLRLAPKGALNIHGSLLPRWRGAAPIQRAVAAGDEETGVSVQRMVLALDEGDVLLERRMKIEADDTSGSLFDKLALLGGEVATAALDAMAFENPCFTPQVEADATYARKLRKVEGEVDWSLDATQLERHVRAMSPWPGAKAATADGKPLVIERAMLSAREGAAPGTVLELSPNLVVACGRGALELHQVKPAGKRAMEAQAWCRGARLELGNKLLGGAEAK